MTSLWAWRRLKSPASRLFNQPFVQARKASRIRITGFVRGGGGGGGGRPVNSLHKRPITRIFFHLMTSSWNHISKCDLCVEWRNTISKWNLPDSENTSSYTLALTNMGRYVIKCYMSRHVFSWHLDLFTMRKFGTQPLKLLWHVTFPRVGFVVSAERAKLVFSVCFSNSLRALPCNLAP